jgi:tetratricopeptide (TPR) repeat protein
MSSLQPAASLRAVPAVLVAVTPPPRWRLPSRRRLTRLGLAALLWLALAVAVSPVSPSDAQYLAGATRARASYRYDRALEDYALAASAAPTDPRPACLTGDVRMLQREWQAAAGAYRRCAAIAPSDAAGWLGLGDALLAQGQTADAEAAWRAAADHGSDTALRRLGGQLERDGRPDDARAAWARLPRGDPQALAHLGLLALWRGDLATARGDFVAARTTDDASTALLQTGDFVDLAARTKLDADYWGRLGYGFLTIGLPALALAPLQTSVRLDPSGGGAHAYLGWTLWQLGRQAEVRGEIAAGVRLDPSLSFAWFAAGQLAAADGKLSAAADAYQNALALDPKNAVVWSSVARLSLARRDYVQAEHALATASDLSTSPADAVALLSFYLDHGLGLQDGRALAAAAKALRRWPHNEPVAFLAARLQDVTGHADDAYYTAQDAVALDPTDPGPYVLLGSYALGEGNYVAAALDLRVALALQPHGPWARQATALAEQVASVQV